MPLPPPRPPLFLSFLGCHLASRRTSLNLQLLLSFSSPFRSALPWFGLSRVDLYSGPDSCHLWGGGSILSFVSITQQYHRFSRGSDFINTCMLDGEMMGEAPPEGEGPATPMFSKHSDSRKRRWIQNFLWQQTFFSSFSLSFFFHEKKIFQFFCSNHSMKMSSLCFPGQTKEHRITAADIKRYRATLWDMKGKRTTCVRSTSLLCSLNSPFFRSRCSPSPKRPSTRSPSPRSRRRSPFWRKSLPEVRRSTLRLAWQDPLPNRILSFLERQDFPTHGKVPEGERRVRLHRTPGSAENASKPRRTDSFRNDPRLGRAREAGGHR